jgi:hypothetical protein
MALKKVIRNLIIGENRYVSSYGDFKQAMLSGYLALMGIMVCLVYIMAHFVLDDNETLPIFLVTIGLLAFSIHLHRRGDHRKANYVLLPTINLTVYLFASSESANAGTFLFFVSNAVAAFAIFPYLLCIHIRSVCYGMLP